MGTMLFFHLALDNGHPLSYANLSIYQDEGFLAKLEKISLN